MNQEIDASKVIEFEHLFVEIGACYYESPSGDRRPATVGAYMSLIDFEIAAEFLSGFEVKDLYLLYRYYDSQRYLSPGFGIIQIAVKNALRKKGVELEEMVFCCIKNHEVPKRNAVNWEGLGWVCETCETKGMDQT